MTVLRLRLQAPLLLLLVWGASLAAATSSASHSRVKRQQLEVVDIPDNPGGGTPSPVIPTFTASPPTTQAPSGGRGLFGSGLQFPSLFDSAGFGGGFDGGAFGGFGRGGANGNNNNGNGNNGNSGFGFNPFGSDGASSPFGEGAGSPFGTGGGGLFGNGRGSPFANGGGFPGGFSGGFPGTGNRDDDLYNPFNSNNIPNTNPGNNIPGSGSNSTNNNNNNNNNPFDVFPGFNSNNNNNGFGPGRPFGGPGNGAGNGFSPFPTRGPPANGAGSGFSSFPTRGPPAFPFPGPNRPTLGLGSNVCTPPVYTPLGDRVANTTVPEEVKSAIAQELSRNSQLSQYLQYASQIRGASVSAPSTEGSDVDCPSSSFRATVFQRYGSNCWILQDNQEPFYYATCNCNQCLAPAGSAQTPGSACEPYLQPTALFAYCQNAQDPSNQITRERVALPVTCRCRHAAPANVQAAASLSAPPVLPPSAAPVVSTIGSGFSGPGQIGAPGNLGVVTSGTGAAPVVFTN